METPKILSKQNFNKNGNEKTIKKKIFGLNHFNFSGSNNKFKNFLKEKPNINEKVIDAVQRDFQLNKFSSEYVFDFMFDDPLKEIKKLSLAYFSLKFEVIFYFSFCKNFKINKKQFLLMEKIPYDDNLNSIKFFYKICDLVFLIF